jgi:hypothetical protein
MWKKIMNKLENEFLLAYADMLGWKAIDSTKISRRLCEEYFYNPKNIGRDFILIFYGWLWGKHGDYIKAKCECGLLQIRMDEIYSIVAKENNWTEINS